ncbi:ribulose-phosphate 3-epimerase [Candidatus Peregrinibacteria bacterium CG10_big_fil_rev_8_21_14_0_10_55_24]|nr:MAG: ribulose-phosphate 3-epimerase [Candidatus Peregrinibacteria bacterium CG10_big_fil_rev_8_21_14_0_10_55_24]
MTDHTLVTPSILSANLGDLQREVESVEAHADWLQVDVMDGHFVPNLSFGAPVVRWLKTSLPLDAHLMVTNPADRIQEFLDVGVKHITFHAEVVEGTAERRVLMESIRAGGATVGIAVNPATPLSAVDDVLSEVDLFLVMSVQPGFGGQAFLPAVLSKVEEAHKAFPKLMIQMDGGIDDQTASLCRKAGANNLVAGSYIFSAQNRSAAIASLRG